MRHVSREFECATSVIYCGPQSLDIVRGIGVGTKLYITFMSKEDVIKY